MSAAFDPYIRWLGIRDPERPPNHYLLLGLTLFEPEAEVIEAAADRQMAHVRTYQSGAQGEISQRVLNELSAARICLLTKEKKAAYDAQLRAELRAIAAGDGGANAAHGLEQPGRGEGIRTRTTPLPVSQPLPTAQLLPTAQPQRPEISLPIDPAPLPPPSVAAARRKAQARKSSSRQTAIVGGVTVGGVLIVGIVAFLLTRGGNPPQTAAGASKSQPKQGKDKGNSPQPAVVKPPDPDPPKSTDSPPRADQPKPKDPQPTVKAPEQDEPPDTVASVDPPLAKPVESLPDEAANEGDVVYLDDLKEVESFIGWGGLGKRGEKGFPAPFTSKVLFRGGTPEHATSFCADPKGSYVVYRLEDGFQRFRATAAMMGEKEDARGPVRFRVLGDGKVLWKSERIQKNDESEDCDVDVRRIKTLRLEIIAEGDPYACWTVWINARLLRSVPKENGATPELLAHRQAVPDTTSQQKSLTTLQDVFKAEYAKAKTPTAQAGLAKLLLEKAREAEEKPADHFVMLKEARRLATEVGDVETAWDAVGQTCAAFDVDLLAEQSALLTSLTKNAKTAGQNKSLAERAGEVFDAALAAGKLELAGELAELAAAAAKKARDTELAKLASLRAQQFQDYKKLATEAESAKKTLADKPDDPEANLALGRFLCLGQDDWKVGLPHLAKGPESALRKAAEGDLAVGEEPKDWIVRGDAWFEVAKNAKEYGPRAAFWYRRAVDEISGLEKTRIEKRLSGLASAGLIVRPAGSDTPGVSSSPTKGSSWAVTADKIVVYNAHGAQFADVGTRRFSVLLLLKDEAVWSRRDIELPWSRDRDEKVVVDLPNVRFDTVRVELTAWERVGPALSEVEVLSNGKNLARTAQVRSSSIYRTLKHHTNNLVDGITSSQQFEVGYWVPILGRRAWAEIDLRPPSASVKADRLVLWNQNNGRHGDFGTAECNVLLYHRSREVWRRDAIEMLWSPKKAEKTELRLPSLEFDRVLVEITKFHQSGGGLAEIEVYQGRRNLALGASTSASAFWRNDFHFKPGHVTDGNTSDEHHSQGYWLLPDGAQGWVEVDLLDRGGKASANDNFRGDRIVIWNQHNGPSHDRWAELCDVVLLDGVREVWRRDHVRIPAPNLSETLNERDECVIVPLPRMRFTRVRVENGWWLGDGGGLAEVEIFQNGKNVARQARVTASAAWGGGFGPELINDGITSSATHHRGYWLLPDNTPGWIELDLGTMR